MHIFKFPPKQVATVLDESIEYIRMGDGATTVVLVNGAGGPIEGWYKVMEPLIGFATVFAYNRPGVGKSSKPAVPQVGSRMLASLRSALGAAGLPPPYVLVGHSLGGLIVNLYARCHPAEVEGVVLLEATSPDDPDDLVRNENGFERLLRQCMERFGSNPNDEIRCIATTVAELRTAPPFPAIPLAVVTGGRPAMTWARSPGSIAARAANQRGLVALSPMGRHVIAGHSGHFPQFKDSTTVVDAIKEVARI